MRRCDITVRKLLTALDQMAERATTAHIIVTSARQQLVLAKEMAEETAKHVQTAVTLPLLNVQRLMTYIHLTEMTRLLPMLPPKEFRRGIGALLIPTPEEERAVRRRVLPYRQMQEIETERIERLRPEEIRQEIREIVLSRTSINLIDQTAFTRLEQWLWTNFPTQAIQILGKLLQQTIAKTWYVERIVGLEPLEKLMLQMYIYAFMEFPLQMNLLGMKVTPLSMSVLHDRVASIYMTYAMQARVVKTKPLIGTAQQRRPETKLVSTERSKQEIIPRKENIAVTTQITKDTVVSTGRNLFGREMFFTALRYAYSLPFWLRRRLVRQLGMPETHKYARYFGIGCIPTRYARYSWKKRHYDEYSGFLYSRDEAVRKYIIYREMHMAGKPNKGRYGGFRLWRKEGYDI